MQIKQYLLVIGGSGLWRFTVWHILAVFVRFVRPSCSFRLRVLGALADDLLSGLVVVFGLWLLDSRRLFFRLDLIRLDGCSLLFFVPSSLVVEAGDGPHQDPVLPDVLQANVVGSAEGDHPRVTVQVDRHPGVVPHFDPPVG